MKKLTSSESLVTINHYKNVLESEGIRCQIRNEFLGGIAGEMPLQEIWPELWVINDIDLDAAIADESPGDNWKCRHCGEVNEGQFAACWNCGTDA